MKLFLIFFLFISFSFFFSSPQQSLCDKKNEKSLSTGKEPLPTAIEYKKVGYWYFTLFQTLRNRGFRDSISIENNGKVYYTAETIFKDITTEKFVECEVVYRYTINSNQVKEIFDEFVNNGFLTTNFPQEQEKLVDEGPQRGFFIEIGDKKIEKIFTDPIDQDLGTISELHKNLTNIGLPKSIIKLQQLFDNVIRIRENRGYIGEGHIYVFDRKKGIHKVELNRVIND